MLFVTGDLHGDLMRLKSPEMKKLRKGDYLLVCGDFGFLWDGSRREQKLLDRLGKLKFHILFVEGAHENYRLLSQIQPTEYCGGMARVISGKLVQLCRGYVFSLCGKKIFAFGGGDNPDLDVELLDEDLPLQRLPTEQDVALARQQLAQNENDVDFIVTHDCPSAVRRMLRMDSNEFHQLNAYFDEVAQICRFRQWFFGSFHVDKKIPPYYHALFKDVVPP